MASNFWQNQPASVGENNNGLIYKPKNKIEEETALPKGLKWKFIKETKLIVTFLQENFITDLKENMSLYYSEELFQKLFNSTVHKDEYSRGIFSEEKLIGFIYGREHFITVDKKEDKIISVNFLCIDKNYRNKGLAPLLITEIKRIAFNNKIYKAIFFNEKNKGFGFTEIAYFHLPLNIEKLKKLIYIPQKYKEIEIEKRKDTILAKEEDLKKIYDLYNKKKNRFEVYETFSYEEFVYTFKNKENSFYCIFNKENDEFASFFIIETMCWEKKVKIKKAYLYYWVGTNKIIEDVFSYAKSLGIDMFDVLNIGENEKLIIETFGLLEGTGRITLHFFNWKIPLKARCRVNMILF